MSLFCDDPGTPPPRFWERALTLAAALAINSPLIAIIVWIGFGYAAGCDVR